MREITDLKELQKVQLDILIFIDKVCKDNDIRYSLSDGTAIGAIRHKGFIPWDDDIDIMMPRPDYEKFLKVIDEANNERYKCYHFSKDMPKYHYTFAKVVDLKTYVDEYYFKTNEKMGINIDIFPLDGINEKTMLKDFKKYKNVERLLYLATYKKVIPTNKKYKTIIKYFAFLFAKMLGINYLNKKAQNIMKKYDWNYSGTCSMYTGLSERKVMPISTFDEFINVEFEGHMFPIIKDYDTYLTKLFGDYMTPPPKEQQITNHHSKNYWKD